MERLSTEQTYLMLGLGHRNSLRSRIKSGELTPIVDKGRNYYDRAEVERYLAKKAGTAPTIFTTPSETMLTTGEPEGGWPV
ncbi:hypothetical protein [Mesorhizobium sp. M0037]|uniref:hypothetical protein n=1 Tax=unclassified Mesorhizobium TaxID=325217 RepID=UPI00333D68DB